MERAGRAAAGPALTVRVCMGTHPTPGGRRAALGRARRASPLPEFRHRPLRRRRPRHRRRHHPPHPPRPPRPPRLSAPVVPAYGGVGSSLGDAPCLSTNGRRMWAPLLSLHTCSQRARGTCACAQPRHRQSRDLQRHMILVRRRAWGTLAYAWTLPRWQMSGRRTYRVTRRVLRSGLLPTRVRQRRRSLWKAFSHRQQLPVRGKWSPSSSPRM